tara:strand:- start:231 stop:1049 length:819 start_codon:yes stop_codon:yes gene_type:complete
MINLKRNNKKHPVPASGLRIRKHSIYSPNQINDFKVSRGKFNDYLSCPKCFYLDRVKGLDPPGTPAWTLNETTDLLLKKEFDSCREKQISHRIMHENKLNNIVPFKNENIDIWRDSLHGGLRVRYKNSNIILTGGVDDIWQDTKTKKLIIVDYKSQAKNGLVLIEDYLNDPYHESYKIQMDFYSYLLKKLGFEVHSTSFFLVCNANRQKKDFNKIMQFEEYLIPYKWDDSWIDKSIDSMIQLMNNYEIPEANPCCKNCAYSDQYSKLKNTTY